MTTRKLNLTPNVLRETFTCFFLVVFYIAVFAWPFGITEQGYMVSRALLTGVIMLAFSLPVWFINIKKVFFREETDCVNKTEINAKALPKIGQIAMVNKWLSPSEIDQILYCQKATGRKFGQVAVKRNFLSFSQLKSLLTMQFSKEKIKLGSTFVPADWVIS